MPTAGFTNQLVKNSQLHSAFYLRSELVKVALCLHLNQHNPKTIQVENTEWKARQQGPRLWEFLFKTITSLHTIRKHVQIAHAKNTHYLAHATDVLYFTDICKVTIVFNGQFPHLTCDQHVKSDTRSPPTGWARQNTAPLNFDWKSSEAAFSAVFSNFAKCRPEVVGDVISGMAVC